MRNDNDWVTQLLKDFLSVIPKNQRYFCIGSVALLSYVEKYQYCRKIKDIDIICDDNNFINIINRLINLGYKQFSFVDKSFPFYNKLSKLAYSKYFRFEKNNRNLEIMTTDFGKEKDQISIEIYPGFKFYIPIEGIVTTQYEKQTIQSASPEILYCIYNLGLETWGKIVKKGVEQRKKDVEQLKNVINADKLKYMANNIFLQLGKIEFRIPTFLLMN